jgi:hypothetical protein
MDKVDQLMDLLGALSPVAVLAGVWLGKRWESRTTTDAWLRDRRLGAYTRFVEGVGELHDGLNAAWRATAVGDGSSIEVDRAYRAMSNTRHEITLLGPSDVSDAAGRALAQLTELVEVFELEMTSDRGDSEASRFVEVSDAALRAKHAFIAAAQHVLVAPHQRS